MPTAGHVGKNTESDEKPQEFSQLSITDKHEHSQLLQGNHPFPSMGVGCFTNKPIWEYRILVVPKGIREERGEPHRKTNQYRETAVSAGTCLSALASI